MKQLPLFEAVSQAYAESSTGTLSNQTLYERICELTEISNTDLEKQTSLPNSTKRYCPAKRKIRWIQQTLKHMGLIQHSGDGRGVWELTEDGKRKLRQAKPGIKMLGFSTNLGIAVFGNCEDVFSRLDIPISLCITSPPYPLAKPRAYGNPSVEEFVDFICRVIEPVIAHLKPGGSICLNVSNDIFEPGTPARSCYRERLVLALCDRFGLYKMDELIWHNPSKPPGPVQWASIKRMQLNVAWEPIYWFTNDPALVFSDNRRVLEPHSKEHLGFLSRGNSRDKAYSDNAYRLRSTSYNNLTEGKIPRNLIKVSHTCEDQQRYKAKARDLGLAPHGAPFPLKLAEFLVQFLSDVNDLVVDPMAGSFTVAKAAEKHNRRWIAADKVFDYVAGAVTRFEGRSGITINPDFYSIRK